VNVDDKFQNCGWGGPSCRGHSSVHFTGRYPRLFCHLNKVSVALSPAGPERQEGGPQDVVPGCDTTM
jgi:hypothetical protein